MPRMKVSLLDRAKADLKAAKHNLEIGINDDVVMDISAYLCSQCAEKTAKYVITLEGKTYVPDHRTDEYLYDLENTQIKELIETISARLDTWATTIRYAGTVKSNIKAVSEVIEVCKRLVKIADDLTPDVLETP